MCFIKECRNVWQLAYFVRGFTFIDLCYILVLVVIKQFRLVTVKEYTAHTNIEPSSVNKTVIPQANYGGNLWREVVIVAM